MSGNKSIRDLLEYVKEHHDVTHQIDILIGIIQQLSSARERGSEALIQKFSEVQEDVYSTLDVVGEKLKVIVPIVKYPDDIRTEIKFPMHFQYQNMEGRTIIKDFNPRTPFAVFRDEQSIPDIVFGDGVGFTIRIEKSPKEGALEFIAQSAGNTYYVFFTESFQGPAPDKLKNGSTMVNLELGKFYYTYVGLQNGPFEYAFYFRVFSS